MFLKTWFLKIQREFFLLRFWLVCLIQDQTCCQQEAWQHFNFHIYRLQQASFRCLWRIVYQWYRRQEWFHERLCNMKRWWFWIFIVLQYPRFGAWLYFLQFRKSGSWNQHQWLVRNLITLQKYLSLKMLSENLSKRLDLPTDELPMRRSLNR